ncbi:hypothetical protein CY35_11G119800 [Sphagnum magellanicum]|nr:hypothetical protein CY35_11G119800 [Sphagnum magellanicum]
MLGVGLFCCAHTQFVAHKIAKFRRAMLLPAGVSASCPEDLLCRRHVFFRSADDERYRNGQLPQRYARFWLWRFLRLHLLCSYIKRCNQFAPVKGCLHFCSVTKPGKQEWKLSVQMNFFVLLPLELEGVDLLKVTSLAASDFETAHGGSPPTVLFYVLFFLLLPFH